MAPKPDPMKMLNDIKQPGKKKGLPPVHLWNPDFCGDIDMRIARDGAWFYMGTPIGRKAMVKLFSTILRHDDDGKFYLVTPVEKVGIKVDDAPFVATLVDVSGEGQEQVLTFTTNVEDTVEASAEHPLRVDYKEIDGEPSPYVHVRANLEALISRNVFYQLVELAEEIEIEGEMHLAVRSHGEYFSIGKMPQA